MDAVCAVLLDPSTFWHISCKLFFLGAEWKFRLLRTSVKVVAFYQPAIVAFCLSGPSGDGFHVLIKYA